jgi:hypothetical protein
MFLQLAGGARTLGQSFTELRGIEFGLTSGLLGDLESMNLGWMTHAQLVEEAHRRIQAAFTNTAEAQRVMATVTQQMNLRYQQQVGQTAQAVGKALVDVFPKSKAAAAAQALINTAVGVTQALTLPFPLNWIQAAAVLASGMAQVAAIKSASVGGGGALPSPGAGGGSGGGGSGPSQAPIRLTIEPVDDKALFAGASLNRLFEEINNYSQNGGVIVATKLVGR